MHKLTHLTNNTISCWRSCIIWSWFSWEGLRSCLYLICLSVLNPSALWWYQQIFLLVWVPLWHLWWPYSFCGATVLAMSLWHLLQVYNPYECIWFVCRVISSFCSYIMFKFERKVNYFIESDGYFKP